MLLFVAEIANIPGHGVFMTFNKLAKLYVRYHLETFGKFVDDQENVDGC